jgi:predicted signal transduction protein with EAL and GGDEF domain
VVSVVRVVDENLVVIAHSVDGPNWIGRDLSDAAAVARHYAARDFSEVVRWSDDVERITGSARTNADLALYQAKSAGRRAYRFFLPVLRAQAQARRSLALELRRAYSENEFELYFQPQVSRTAG